MMRTGDGVVDGKYRILRQLGQGGMGVVYEAQHLGTGRRVALKVIVSEALAKENDVLVRFQREARASGSIDSQHVVQVLDTGVDPATQSPYMVMELLAGEDVHDLVQRLGALDPDLVLRLMAQACLGLQRAHDMGVVHRDIKSANMFLARREGDERVLKLLDFGIAKVRADQLAGGADHGLTRTGAMLGSPLYMSPEQALGAKSLDGRSDLYSLGVVMYEALTGATPNGHCETLGELILAICSRPTEPVQSRASWVPPEVAAVVHRALAQDAAHRFESAAAMHTAIVALLPQGGGIHEAMLVGVSPATRAQIATRFERLIAASLGSHVPSTGRALASSGPVSSTTGGVGGGAGVTGADARGSGSPPGWLVAGGAVLLVGVLVAGFVIAPWRSKAARPAATEAASAASAAASTTDTTIAPAPTLRTVHVSIAAPADAKVEVDGRPVDVKDHAIDVRGALGSVHPVRVVSAGREARAEVTIAEAGPSPDRVDLVVPKVAAGGGRSGAPAIALAATGGTASAGALPPATKQSGSAPSAGASQPAGAPTISRNF